ncbi:Toxin Doc [Acaryochloris thomasi RCC1774]|uniref:Toxin Doc n=1 Tax=Acaryochloris thomasi RCC1774 TaxID=1764569 RepID=A0A2W1K6W1_9CYAN|nr:type II toxin-antitoxin system death-on-curing family toxin [Acaryochloris thomasi]PZD75421.1 Toxin Doc [Acaryochloris thomasi RCC1774]
MTLEPRWLTLKGIVTTQVEIIAVSGGASGILDEGALESTLNKPRQLHYYGENVTLCRLAAAYGYGFVQNHCFVDGNKRIALVAAGMFMVLNGTELIAFEAAAATFFLDLAASSDDQETSMQRLADWLANNSTH